MSETVNPVITAERLSMEGACDEQVGEFIRLFGDLVEVTEETAVEHAEVFDWSWASGTLLDDPSLVRYQGVMAAAHKAFQEAAQPIRRRRIRALNTADERYSAATSPSREDSSLDYSAAETARVLAIAASSFERDAALAPLYRALREAQARAFARAYRAQCAEKVS